VNGLAVALAVLALVASAVLACVVAATLRAVDRLRIDVAALRVDSHRAFDVVDEAIPVGSPAPPFAATAPDGARYSSADLDGTLRLVAFARPGCPPCEELVPALLRDAERGALPPAVVVSRGGRGDQPDTWLTSGRRARVVLEEEDRVSRLFQSAVAPLVFVVTPADRVGARGVATNVEDVRALLATATETRP
jgi:hypothetical protein